MSVTATMETAAVDITAIDAPPMNGVTPHLNVVGASEASAFYQKAFGAREAFRLPADDGRRLMHCALVINGGNLMICDCFPEMGGFEHQPSASFTMHLQVDDIEAWFNRAVEAGAQVLKPIEDMFWGDRYARLLDPYGVHWALGQTKTA